MSLVFISYISRKREGTIHKKTTYDHQRDAARYLHCLAASTNSLHRISESPRPLQHHLLMVVAATDQADPKTSYRYHPYLSSSLNWS